MSVAAAIVASIIHAALALFQLALILGAPIGRFAWGGQHRVLPRNLRFGSVVAIALYALFSAILLQRADLIAVLPGPVVDIGVWAVLAYLVLGIFMNGISMSLPERLTMVPVCIVLAGLTLVVAMGW